MFDIIVSVNHCDRDFKRCLLKLESYAYLFNHIVFLSAEDISLQIKEMLKNQSFCHVHFKENFSAALFCTEHDCVVINSSCVIEKRCVDLLCEHAYLRKEYGIVVPISNRMISNTKVYENEYFNCMEGKISDFAEGEFDLPEMYCCFIKREVIQYIELNEEAEPGDFVTAAQYMGYKVVMSPKAFICDYDEKLVKVNDVSDDVQEIADLFKIYSFIANDKKNILYFIHADFHEAVSNHIGGTQFHVKDLTLGLKNTYNVFVMSRDEQFLRMTIYVGNETLEFKFFIGEACLNPVFFDSNLEYLLETVLRAFKIDLVHVHHTFTLSLDIFYVAKSLNVPLYLTVHDFYYLCPSINLLNEKNEYCLLNSDSLPDCEECLAHKLKCNRKYIKKWRAESEKIFSLCDKIIMPSYSTKRIFTRFNFAIDNKVIVTGHGYDSKKIKDYHKKSNELKNIAFIGGIHFIKGSDLAYELITKSDTNFNWYIFGGISDIKLVDLEQESLTKVGWYKREELSALFEAHQIDLVCILSICPETFCYTLSETIANGIPLLVTDIGALGERVEALKCGWKMPLKSSTEEYLEKIRGIFTNKDDYLAKKDNINCLQLKTIAAMVNEYEKIYQSSLQNSKVDYMQGALDSKLIYQAYLKVKKDNILIGKNDSENEEIEQLQRELVEIKGTLGYKCVCWLRQLNIPLINYIKKIIRVYIK